MQCGTITQEKMIKSTAVTVTLYLLTIVPRLRGSNTYLPRSNANQFITVIKCSFLDVFVDILSLTVKIHQLLQL